MNIFALSEDPVEAAHALFDRHVGKCAIECGQILHAALSRHGYRDDRPTYNPNGRFSVWAATSRDNFQWLVTHGLELLAEHRRRYGTDHSTGVRLRHMQTLVNLVPEGPRTPFARSKKVSPDGDAVEAYRQYYKIGKAALASWTKGRPPPEWWLAKDITCNA